MKMEINNYYTKEVIFKDDLITSSKELLEKAVKEKVPLVCADLRNLSLPNAILREGDFRYAKFDGSDCKGANFSEADLIGADLSNSCQSSTNYTAANISYSELWCVNFRHSNWTDIKNEGIRVKATKLSNVFLGEKYGKIIKCNIPFIQISPVGMYQDCLQAYRTDKGMFIKLGKFFDSVEKFEEQLKIMKQDKKDVVEYQEIIKMLQTMANNPNETYEN